MAFKSILRVALPKARLSCQTESRWEFSEDKMDEYDRCDLNETLGCINNNSVHLLEAHPSVRNRDITGLDTAH